MKKGSKSPMSPSIGGNIKNQRTNGPGPQKKVMSESAAKLQKQKIKQ